MRLKHAAFRDVMGKVRDPSVRQEPFPLSRLAEAGPAPSIDTGTAFELVLAALIVADPGEGRPLDEAALWGKRAKLAGGGTVATTIRWVGREPWINALG